MNTLRSGFSQFRKNEIPAYEIISDAAIAFAAFLLIIPGCATDIFRVLFIFPLPRKIIIKKISTKFKKETTKTKPYIEGEFEEVEDDDERKL